MDTKRLRYFIAVVSEGSISRAAAKLDLAQPAISQQIKILEAEVSAVLLDRSPRGVTPTRAGRILFERASQILNDLDRTRADIKAPASAPVLVTVCIAQSAGLPIAVPLLRRCLRDYGHLRLRIREAGSMALLDTLQQGLCDVAVLPRYFEIEDVRTDLLYREELFLFAPAAWSLVGRVGFAEIASLPLVHSSTPHAIRSIIEAQFAQVGYAPEILAEVNSYSVIRQMVIDGLAATILPGSAFQGEAGVARIALQPAVTRPMFLYTRGSEKHVATVSELIRDIAAYGL